MKDFLKKLGFSKPDEMEQHIAFKAQRNALIFLWFALFIWTLYESYKVYTFHTQLNLLPCLLLVTSTIIQLVSQVIMSHNAVKDDEEAPKIPPILKQILLCIIIVAVIVTIGSIIVVKVIRS
ncbi:MAG: hypothetical protein IKJ88_03460 [Clostridia bacterium]|nr:hypothetical protein [Clostridia bacterium]